MPSTPSLDFNVIDGTQIVTPADGSINAVLVETLRGPYGTVSPVITSFEEFKRTYGGLDESLPGLYQVKRALDGGSKLRVVKVGELSNGVPTANKATEQAPFLDSSTAIVNLFKIHPKYAGSAYNEIIATIKDASNGGADYFDLVISFNADGVESEEVYTNLTIPGAPTATGSNYLAKVTLNSSLVDVEYLDASAVDVPSRPVNVVVTFAGGDDGFPTTTSDYEESLEFLDNVDDFTYVAVFGFLSTTLAVAMASYATGRKDCIAMIELGDTANVDTIIAGRQATNIDSEFAAFFTGEIEISNPISGTANPTIFIPILGDALAAQALTATEVGPWISFAGSDRGTIFALSVKNNRGSKAKKADLEKLAQAQVNTVINRSGKIMLWHSFSGQIVESQKSFLSIVELTLFIAKSLEPTLERYIEKPLDFILISTMFKEVKPFLDSLIPARALFDYTWQGDQSATSLDGLVLNDPNDFTQGKYKVNLFLQSVAPLQDMEVNIILTRTGVEIS